MDTGCLSGVENMAIDESLLASFDPAVSQPILRLYGWSPPAFSYGRFQNPAEIIDLKLCAADGVQVVRRATGGGVIFHGEELTYSLVVSPEFIPGSPGVKDAFFYLTSFLLNFYKKLGLEPQYAAELYPGARLGDRSALCYSANESCDILIGGRKIGGNAQKRLKGAIFQHGSIPLRKLARAMEPYLLRPDSTITEKTTSLGDEGVDLGRDELAVRLASAFCGTFGVQAGLEDMQKTE